MADSAALSLEFAPRSDARPPLRVLLAAPRGFCAGVRRAIAAVVDTLERFGPPVYVRRAIVHNLAVVRDLERRGAVFVEEIDEVPPASVLVLSAHGVAQSVRDEARARDLRVVDAMCPLVGKVHREVLRHHRDGRHVLVIGHRGHPEIDGTLGQLPAGAAEVVSNVEDVERVARSPGAPIAYAVQTTFSVEEAAEVAARIEARFDDVARPFGNDICYATTNRQAALRAIAPAVDAVIVVGEHFSSNATRLAELARAQGCASVQLVADADRLDWGALEAAGSVGITAAASTPEHSVQEVLAALGEQFDLAIDEVQAEPETARFKPVRVG